MDWTKFASIDPHLLVGLVNTEIRNHCNDLEDLCRTHDISQAKLIIYLSKAGYARDWPRLNSFQPHFAQKVTKEETTSLRDHSFTIHLFDKNGNNFEGK